MRKILTFGSFLALMSCSIASPSVEAPHQSAIQSLETPHQPATQPSALLSSSPATHAEVQYAYTLSPDKAYVFVKKYQENESLTYRNAPFVTGISKSDYFILERATQTATKIDVPFDILGSWKWSPDGQKIIFSWSEFNEDGFGMKIFDRTGQLLNAFAFVGSDVVCSFDWESDSESLIIGFVKTGKIIPAPDTEFPESHYQVERLDIRTGKRNLLYDLYGYLEGLQSSASQNYTLFTGQLSLGPTGQQYKTSANQYMVYDHQKKQIHSIYSMHNTTRGIRVYPPQFSVAGNQLFFPVVKTSITPAPELKYQQSEPQLATYDLKTHQLREQRIPNIDHLLGLSASKESPKLLIMGRWNNDAQRVYQQQYDLSKGMFLPGRPLTGDIQQLGSYGYSERTQWEKEDGYYFYNPDDPDIYRYQLSTDKLENLTSEVPAYLNQR